MRRHFKKILVVLLVVSFLMTSVAIAEPLSTAAIYSVIAWVWNAFACVPQTYSTSIGTICPVATPDRAAAEFLGIKGSLYPKIQKVDSPGETVMLNLVRGWNNKVVIYFPTGEREVRRAYWRKDNGIENGMFDKPPYSLSLDANDNDPHFVEIGVNTGGKSGGSVTICYRVVPAEIYYAEMLADQKFAAFSRKMYQEKEMPQPAKIESQEEDSRLSAVRQKYGSSQNCVAFVTTDVTQTLKVTLFQPGREPQSYTRIVDERGFIFHQLPPGTTVAVQDALGRNQDARELNQPGEVVEIHMKGGN